ncbi:MAG TPA: L-threonylcarbamoyladenylate synthase [Gaiellaceae bacterium]|nr:L-threonylcarbamoyladenylate synthase [Gaiellaceae bacterium]
MSGVAEVAAALRAGRPAIVPTDTVYGLACRPDREEAVRELQRLKGRRAGQPIALVAASVAAVVERLPELPTPALTVLRALLPGPYTLVLENPAGRFPWLAGERPGTLGVRVPAVTGRARELLEEVEAVAATSANLHGGPDPRRVADVPARLRAAAPALDVGELPGTPSTVLDLTGPEPAVLREGAVPADEALARVRAALGQ